MFDVSERSEYVQMMITKCIDQYSKQRQQGHLPDKRLENMVNRMFHKVKAFFILKWNIRLQDLLLFILFLVLGFQKFPTGHWYRFGVPPIRSHWNCHQSILKCQWHPFLLYDCKYMHTVCYIRYVTCEMLKQIFKKKIFCVIEPNFQKAQI